MSSPQSSISSSSPPKSLLLPQVTFPTANQSSDSSQPPHQISPDFILSGFQSTHKCSDPLQPTQSFKFEPFKLSTTSSPYIPSFLQTPTFGNGLFESKTSGIFTSPTTATPSSSETTYSATTTMASTTPKAKSKSDSSTENVDTSLSSKGQITILKRNTMTSDDTTAKPIPSKSTSGLKPQPAVTTLPLKSPETLPNNSYAKVENEISKSICDSIERVLFPKIETALKSLIDDLRKFQINCAKKYNEAIDSLSLKLDQRLSQVSSNLELATQNMQDSLLKNMESIQRPYSEYIKLFIDRPQLITRLLTEGKYFEAIKEALLVCDKAEILPLLEQIPLKSATLLERLSLAENFKLICFFKDIIDEGPSSSHFLTCLFWLYESLLKVQTFIETILPYRSPTGSSSNIHTLSQEIKSDAHKIFQEITNNLELKNGGIVSLFEALSFSYQRNVLQMIPSIIPSLHEGVGLSERKLKLTNRLILSLQVELDKLLNDDY